jgi:hypothetical protein
MVGTADPALIVALPLPVRPPPPPFVHPVFPPMMRATFCGDGICNGSESPDSCPGDCGDPEMMDQ